MGRIFAVVGFPSDLANSQPVDSQSGFGHTLRRSAAVSRLFPPLGWKELNRGHDHNLARGSTGARFTLKYDRAPVAVGLFLPSFGRR